MNQPAGDDFWYPSKNVILGIHEQVIEEDDDSEPGIRSPDQVQFAVTYIEEGHFGQLPETIHEKAFHLMRLIAANHWFVDGNKRTALNTTVLFYYANGYVFETGDDLRAMVKLFSVREDLVSPAVGPEFFETRANQGGEAELEELLDYETTTSVIQSREQGENE